MEKIDRAYLSHLMNGNEAMVDKLIDSFLNDISIYKRELDDFLLAKDFEMLSNTAHKIKTQSAYLSLNQLNALSQEIEKLCDESEKSNELGEKVDELIRRMIRIKASEAR